MSALPFELQPPDRLRTRVEVVAGFFVTLAMVFLGLMWPSLLSVVALAIAPAPLLFIGAMLKRDLITRHGLRAYLRIAVYASILCLSYYVYFILTKTAPA